MPDAVAARPSAQQERSRRTERRILSAALDTLRDFGEEAITMSAVSERAGVSVGSIYRRFGSRDELLVAMTAEFAQGFARRVHIGLAAAGPEDLATAERTIAYATTTLTHQFERHSRPFGRLLLMGLAEPRLFREGQRASREGGQDYASFILRAQDAIRRPDPATAVDFTYLAIYAVCSHHITQGATLSNRRPFGWRRITAELVESNVAYLLTAPRGA